MKIETLGLKAILEIEFHRLPAPDFRVADHSTIGYLIFNKRIILKSE